MKSFTKEFSHKCLRRLKEKGKLRKPRETSNSTSADNSHPETPRKLNGHVSPSTSPSASTSRREHDAEDEAGRRDSGMLDEMFGASDDEGDDDMEMPVLDAQSGTTTSNGIEPSPLIATPSPPSDRPPLSITRFGPVLVNSWKPGLDSEEHGILDER